MVKYSIALLTSVLIYTNSVFAASLNCSVKTTEEIDGIFVKKIMPLMPTPTNRRDKTLWAEVDQFSVIVSPRGSTAFHADFGTFNESDIDKIFKTTADVKLEIIGNEPDGSSSKGTLVVSTGKKSYEVSCVSIK